MTVTDIAYVGSAEREFGWESAVVQFIADSNEIARAARPLWVHPRWAQIQAARVLDHRPCNRRQPCRCSRCIHASAWERRGGRPYLGLAAEAALRAGVR